MKNKILMFIMLVMFIMFLPACINNEDKITIKDDSKVLATVDGNNITEQMVELAALTSTFSSEEMLEKIIDNELLLIKAKELKINVSDKDAKNLM